MRGKVAVVGVGAVGTTVVNDLLQANICEKVCLIDLNTERAFGEARDLKDYTMYLPYDVDVFSGTYADCEDMDAVVICASGRIAPGTENKGRNAFVEMNGKIVKSVVGSIMASGFNGVLILITNPVDVMTYLAWKVSGLPREKVMGTGGFLDTQRLRWAIREKTGVHKLNIDAMCLGEHGETMMVPWELAHIGDKTGEELFTEEEQTELLQEAMEIAHQSFSRKGATQFGIAGSTVDMLKAILTGENRVLPVSAVMDGEYGYHDVAVTVPCLLDRRGIHVDWELPLNEKSKAALDRCTAAIRSNIEKLPS